MMAMAAASTNSAADSSSPRDPRASPRTSTHAAKEGQASKHTCAQAGAGRGGRETWYGRRLSIPGQTTACNGREEGSLHLDGRRQRHGLDCHLRDDPQRPLGADEELLHVVAHVVLA